MKRFLTAVTLGLIGTVVVVLATHLILIAVALVRANRNLAKLVGGLEAIRDNTAPLEADLGAVSRRVGGGGEAT